MMNIVEPNSPPIFEASTMGSRNSVVSSLAKDSMDVCIPKTIISSIVALNH